MWIAGEPISCLGASVAAIVDAGRADRLAVLLALRQSEVLLSNHSSRSIHDSD